MLKRMVFRIISILIGLSLGLLIGETFLRYTLPDRMFYRINISSTDGDYKLSDNPRLIYVPVPNTGSFNSYGHRGAAFSFKKGSKKRIVVMGDSVVEGLGVGLDQRFTDILDKHFNEQYEIINLGVCGYSLLQEFEYFRLLGEKFSPDYVLWFISFNDMRLHSGEIYTFNDKLKNVPNSTFYETYYRTRIEFERFLMSFNTYKLVKYVYSVESQKVFNNNEEIISLDEADNLLQQLATLSRERNFRLTFIFLPTNTHLYESEIDGLKYLIQKNNVPYLDLRGAFKTYSSLSSVEIYFLRKDACHLSTEGNKAFADILYENRTKLGL